MRGLAVLGVALLGCTGEPDPEVCDALWFDDADGDGFGLGDGVQACQPGADQVALDGDCDDADPAVFPGAPDRVCDGVDSDCVGGAGAAWVDPDAQAEYATIAEALAAAPDEGTVWICPGVHHEHLVVTRAVTLRADGGDPVSTVIEGDGDGALVRTQGAPLLLTDLTLRGGRGADEAGGVEVRDADLEVRGCTFADNTSESAGGAITLHTSAATGSTLSVQASTFSGNEGYAGAIHVQAPPGVAVRVSLDGVTMRANEGAKLAGGLGVEAGVATVTVTGSTFEENRGLSGALRLSGHPDSQMTARITSCQFTRNIGGRGTALAVDVPGTTTLDIDASRFEYNEAQEGGALAFVAGRHTVGVRDSAFVGNEAGRGGALYSVAAQGLTFIGERLAFTDNTGTLTGGAWSLWGRPPVAVSCDDCTFSANHTFSGAAGAAIEVHGDPDAPGRDLDVVLGGGSVLHHAEPAISLLGLDATLTSDAVDWGQGDDDNAHDVEVPGLGSWDWDAVASFTCDGAAGCR